MRKIYSTLFVAGLCFANSASAQSPQFVNGSLEPTVPASSINACNAMSNLTFNYDMGGTAYAFGTITSSAGYGMYFNDSACIDSTQKLGKYALAMDWASTGYTEIALKVSPAMQAGHSYTITYWYESSLLFSSCNLEIGYSADSSAFGTSIGNIYQPGVYPIPQTWLQGTATFTPTVACSWITVQTTSSTQNYTNSPYMYTIIDDFSFSGSTSVNGVESNNSSVHISPNPAKDAAYATFNNSVFQNNITVTINDITGRSIQHTNIHLATGANSIKLDLENIPAGMYLVNITNGKESATQKLVVAK